MSGPPRPLSKGSKGPASFEMDRAEGGSRLVSAELKDRLNAHGLADEATLQALWDLSVWSVSDLEGLDPERLVQVDPFSRDAAKGPMHASCPSQKRPPHHRPRGYLSMRALS